MLEIGFGWAAGCSRFHTTFESVPLSVSLRSQCSPWWISWWMSWWSWWSWWWWSWWSGVGNHSLNTFHLINRDFNYPQLNVILNIYKNYKILPNYDWFPYLLPCGMCWINLFPTCEKTIAWHAKFRKNIFKKKMKTTSKKTKFNDIKNSAYLLSIPIFYLVHTQLCVQFSKFVATHSPIPISVFQFFTTK